MGWVGTMTPETTPPTMSSEELKPCPFCGGDVSFHKDEECSGCHLIQCGQCRAFFDFATGADPGNDCESVDALRAAIAPMWNRRTTLASQQSAHVSVPRELIERIICRLSHAPAHDKTVRELRALLATPVAKKSEVF